MKPGSAFAAGAVPILRGAAIVAGAFSALMAAAVLITAIRLNASDPLAAAELAALKREVAARPADAVLAETIRIADQAAREEYFTARKRIDSGAIILAVSFALFVAALRGAAYLTGTIPDPKTAAREPLSRVHGRARTALAVSAGLILGAAGICGLLSTRDLPEDARKALNAVGLGGFPSRSALRENWPSFRGPSEGSVPREAAGADGFGGAELAVLWRAPAGLQGTGSPVIWGNAVFLCGASAESQEISRYDAETGRQVWRIAARDLLGQDQPAPEVSADTGWAAPTPACDGRRLFVMFASGRLMALSLDGRLLWSRDFGIPENPYGIASSIAVWKDEVIVQFDQSNTGMVAAFHGGSGKPIWIRERRLMPSWATPLVVDEPEWSGLVVVGNPAVEALDLSTGRLLWSVDCMSGETAPSAAYSGGRAFAVTAMASAVALSCLKDAEANPGDTLWTYEEDLPDISSPLAVNGRLYFASSPGTVTCLDAQSGGLLWKHAYDARISSSPVNVDGVVFMADASGVLHRFREASSFTALPDVDLGGPTVSTPAFHAGRLYLRAGGELVCVGRKK